MGKMVTDDSDVLPIIDPDAKGVDFDLVVLDPVFHNFHLYKQLF